jgi:hypothetical protein
LISRLAGDLLSIVRTALRAQLLCLSGIDLRELDRSTRDIFADGPEPELAAALAHQICGGRTSINQKMTSTDANAGKPKANQVRNRR